MSECIGKRLKESRALKGYTQTELALLAGLPTGNRITQYETCVHVPDFETLKSIGLILNRPIAYFYAEDDNLAQIILLVDSFTRKSQKELINQLQTGQIYG